MNFIKLVAIMHCRDFAVIFTIFTKVCRVFLPFFCRDFLLSLPVRHLCTWVTTYTWYHPPSDHALFHPRSTFGDTSLGLPGHVYGIASQHTCVTRTLPIAVLGMNFRHWF